MHRFTRTCAAFGLTAGLALAPALFAQEGPRDSSSGDVASPGSQSPALRDPTRAPSWRAVATQGSLQGVRLPDLRLRGRAVSKRGAIGLLSIGDELHLVRPGDTLSLVLDGAAIPRAAGPARGGRAPAPLAQPGSLNLTLRVERLDASGLRLEIAELRRTITLR